MLDYSFGLIIFATAGFLNILIISFLDDKSDKFIIRFLSGSFIVGFLYGLVKNFDSPFLFEYAFSKGLYLMLFSVAFTSILLPATLVALMLELKDRVKK